MNATAPTMTEHLVPVPAKFRRAVERQAAAARRAADRQLADDLRAEISAHADAIAAELGLDAENVLRGLAAHWWPLTDLGPTNLAYLLFDAAYLLADVRAGGSLGGAIQRKTVAKVRRGLTPAFDPKSRQRPSQRRECGPR
jgi:hypothetical protein